MKYQISILTVILAIAPATSSTAQQIAQQQGVSNTSATGNNVTAVSTVSQQNRQQILLGGNASCLVSQPVPVMVSNQEAVANSQAVGNQAHANSQVHQISQQTLIINSNCPSQAQTQAAIAAARQAEAIKAQEEARRKQFEIQTKLSLLQFFIPRSF